MAAAAELHDDLQLTSFAKVRDAEYKYLLKYNQHYSIHVTVVFCIIDRVLFSVINRIYHRFHKRLEATDGGDFGAAAGGDPAAG